MRFLALFFLFSLATTLSAQSTRLFVDDQGHEVEVPAAPQRIVALRGDQFVTPLLELGAPVIGATGYVVEGVNNGSPIIRGAHDLLNATFENTGITFVGVSQQPDLERIASLKPDLILLPDFAADNYRQLSLIAPTVVINIWPTDAASRYRRIADAAGKLPEFKRLKARFTARLNAAKALTIERFGDPASVSVAIAEVNGKRFRVYKNYGAMSYLLDELGFSRPAVIENMKGVRLDLSPELVEKINSDFLVSTYTQNFGQPLNQVTKNWDTLIPGWDLVLHAPRHNQHILLARETMRALSFQSMEEVLAIYVSNIVARKFVALPK